VSATIKDVARVAQVSVATVSRALNGHHNVTPEVRRRVEEAAGQLRYVPHAAARSLSSRRTQTLGVVLPDLHGEFFSELVRGIDQAARECGMHLLVSSYHGHPEEQGEALRTLRGRVDGLLVMSPFAGMPPPTADRQFSALPTVLINSPAAPDGDVLSVDNYGGARTMVEHLLASGHRRIAFIGGPEGNFDAHERLRGYHDALAAGAGAGEPWVLPGDFSEAAGHRAGQALLQSSPRPDAVFAANDMMALGCLFAFSQGGLSVPDDIALAGFDDIPLAHYMHPALTTMRVNIAHLGESAARVLIARLGGDDSPIAATRLTPELIVRASSRRPTSDSS
jgi:LacI family transcriptional regulator